MTRGERGISIRPYAPGDEAAMAALVAHTLRVSNRADYSPEYLDKIAESTRRGISPRARRTLTFTSPATGAGSSAAAG